MNEQKAISIAMAARSRFGVTDTFVPRSAEKRIIELVEDGHPVDDRMPEPGPVRDTVAWVVTLRDGDVAETEFAVEDATEQIVRFRRSRTAAVKLSRTGKTE